MMHYFVPRFQKEANSAIWVYNPIFCFTSIYSSSLLLLFPGMKLPSGPDFKMSKQPYKVGIDPIRTPQIVGIHAKLSQRDVLARPRFVKNRSYVKCAAQTYPIPTIGIRNKTYKNE